MISCKTCNADAAGPAAAWASLVTQVQPALHWSGLCVCMCVGWQLLKVSDLYKWIRQ